MNKIQRPLLLISMLLLGIWIGLKLESSIQSGKLQELFSRTYSSSENKIDDVLSLIKREYVDTVNISQLQDDAIVQMLKNLDPHTVYIPASELTEVNESLQSKFEGIGVQFRIIDDTITVIMPIAGGPSAKVGILAGDRIVKVNDTVVAGVGIKDVDVMKKLKGPKNTKVKLTMARNGLKKTLDFIVIRDVIPTYSIDYSGMITNQIGYIKVSKFSSTTYAEFKKALTSLVDQKMKKLIVDLRGNGGGFLNEVIKMSDEFLKKDQMIVYTKGRNRTSEIARATSEGSFENGELVILIDEFSASASEIMAGAIQDNDRGTIVGRRSFGKGLVQEQIPLRDGSALRLTVARYYTPTGRCIQRPYIHGDDNDYFEDLAHRYESGELEHPESIKFPDSLAFKTPKGKKVYGGGGIMPDVFVPYQSDTLIVYYNKLLSKGLIYQFAFEYTDKNRSKLNQYKSFSDFNTQFIVTDNLFNELVQYAESKGINRDARSIAKYGNDMKILFKAYIARNLYDDKGFYPVYFLIDKDLKKALDILKR